MLCAQKNDDMSSNQTVLAVAAMASMGRVERAVELAATISMDRELLLKLACSLVPELADPAGLALVLDYQPRRPAPDPFEDAVLVDTIASFPELRTLADSVAPETLAARIHALSAHLTADAMRFHAIDNSLQFVQARTHKLYELTGALHFNQPLFELLLAREAHKQHTGNFTYWYHTSLKSFEYLASLNPYTEYDFRTFDYELGPLHKFGRIVDLLLSFNVLKISPAVVNFVQCNEPVLVEYLNAEGSALDPSHLLLLNHILLSLQNAALANNELFASVQRIYLAFPGSELTPEVLESMEAVLDRFSSSSSTATSEIDETKELVSTAKILHYNNSLSSLKSLKGSDSSHQLQYLSEFLQSSKHINLSQVKLLRKSLFTNISESQFDSNLLTFQLNNKLFSQIEHCSNASSKQILINHFWKCFKNATNFNKSYGELANAKSTLSLLPPDEPEFSQLNDFLNAIHELSNYSIRNMDQHSLNYKPSDLMNLSNLSGLFQSLLENNQNAYKDFNTLSRVSKIISSELKIPTVSEVSLLCQCIQFSLVHQDPQFAIEQSLNLLATPSPQTEIPELVDHWMIFFQVGKYMDPKWQEGGEGMPVPPADIIKNQMVILTKLLKFAPIIDSQIIIAQWNSLELELSLIEEEQEQQQQLNQHDGASENDFSNILAKGLNWAIGSH